MGTCAIEIAGSQHNYRPGETIRGEVVVHVTEPIDCRGLTIATEYRTEGSVSTFVSEPRTRRLFAGQWPAGEHRYAFELPVPPGPATYRGSSLKVMHWLVARADLAWTKDPVAERRFAVAAEDVPGYDDGPGWAAVVPERPVPEGADAAPVGCLLWSALTFVSCLGLVVLLVTFASANDPDANLWTMIPFSLGLLFGPTVLASTLYRGRFASRGLGWPDVHLERTTVRAGESSTVRVLFRVPRRLALSRAVVDLECTELAFIGSGKGSRVRRQTVYRDELPLGVPHQVAAGDTIERVLDIPIPRNVPPTFVAPNAMLVWRVGVHIAAGRDRYMTRLLPVTVRPPSARTSPGSSA